MDTRLALRVVKDNWRDPSWWKDSAVPFAKRTALSASLKPYYRMFGPEGDDFMDEDWDNLLILDACRYDMFETTCDIDGELAAKTSVGSSTPEFLKRTFNGRSFANTVYITANPQVNLRIDPDIFHSVINVWESDWNDRLGTVEPEAVTKQALEAQDRYPNKRLIVHYMQPHYPFIGKNGQDNIRNHSGFELTKRLASNEDETANRDVRTVWDQLKVGELSEEIVWDAYIENLERVLGDIEASLDEFRGKTVITSDHGNLVGEITTPFNLRLYGHPTGVHAENLVTVPWLTYNNSPRKQIYGEEAVNSTDEPSEKEKKIIDDRLEDLGYT